MTPGVKCPILHPHPQPDVLPDLIPGDAYITYALMRCGGGNVVLHTQGLVGANQFSRAAVSSTVKRECILMSREENVFSS